MPTKSDATFATLKPDHFWQTLILSVKCLLLANNGCTYFGAPEEIRTPDCEDSREKQSLNQNMLHNT